MIYYFTQWVFYERRKPRYKSYGAPILLEGLEGEYKSSGSCTINPFFCGFPNESSASKESRK